jgi:hypothetical protein
MRTSITAIIVPAILALAACGSEPSPNEIVILEVVEKPVPVIVEKEVVVEKEVPVSEPEIIGCYVVIKRTVNYGYKHYRQFHDSYTSDKKAAWVFSPEEAKDLVESELRRGRPASTECFSEEGTP